MKILFISPLCPLPLEKGGAVRIWNIAKELSKRHTLDLVCFIRQDGERRFEDDLTKVFRTVKFVKRRGLLDRSALNGSLLAPIKFFVANTSLVTDTLFSSKPLLSELYESAEMKDFLLMADKSGEYDLLFAETFYSIASLRNNLSELRTKLLLIEQNIESRAYSRQSDQQKSPLLKKLMQHDVKKIQSEEEYFWKKVSLVGGLSSVDVDVIKQKSSRPVLMLENGVDIGWFSEKISERDNNEVLFVGSFTYFQNIDSVKWMLEEIWPKIASRYSVKLRIVGRGADTELKRYVHEKGFYIDEGVDDIRAAFQQASVLLAPIRAGSGTKYKILEAMASKLPVVTTALGAEGINVADSKQILIGNTSDELVESVIDLLHHQDKGRLIAEKAYDFVKEKYDWATIVSKFESQLLGKL
jgi:polysaccharide biosynthesis protein PslH